MKKHWWVVYSVAGTLLLAGPALAGVTLDFNAPTYSDGLLLGGLDSWTSPSGTSGFPISVVDTATDGRVRVGHRPAGSVRESHRLIGPVGPGGDGKIYVKFDLELGGGTNPATIGSHLLFKDAAGLELARFDVKPTGARGRAPGGLSAHVGTYMDIGAPNADVRTMWAVVDTLADEAGIGGRVSFYQDSIAPANQLAASLGDLTIPYGSDRTDAIAEIVIDSTSAAGDDSFSYYDNIMVSEVPEPATLGLLAVGLVSMFRRRRP